MKVTGVLCAVVSFVLLALLLSVFARGEMTVGLFVALACAALNLVGLLMGSLPEQAKDLSVSNAFLTEAAEFTALPEQRAHRTRQGLKSCAKSSCATSPSPIRGRRKRCWTT